MSTAERQQYVINPSRLAVALHDFVTCLAAQATSKDVALSTQTLNELKGR